MKINNASATGWSFRQRGWSSLWRKVAYTMSLVVLVAVRSYAQTERIVPLGDGGFENGTTFAANGWTLANSASVNQFALGTLGQAAPFSNRSAYTSNDLGVTATYSTAAATVNYFYRDVTVPAGETVMGVSFNWVGQGESAFDLIQVFAAPTSLTPAASTTYPGSGNAVTNLVGATFLGSVQLNAAVQTATFGIPGSFAGTTFRLIFGWKSDTSVGTQPSVQLDNISLLSQAPALVSATATGGLWSSSATWAGGIVPLSGNDILIPAGSTVTIDQAINYRDYTIDGTLNWGATTFTMTATGNVTISPTGRFFGYTTGGAGQTIACLGDFINNGYANLVISALQFGGINHSLGGSGTYVGNIVNSILMQGTGTLTVNTATPLIARGSLLPLRGTINTNGLLSADNTVAWQGLPSNTRVETIAVTNMGSGLTTAPEVTGTWTVGTSLLWTASTALVVNNRYISGGNVYVCTTAGTSDVVGPTHTSGIAADGTAQLLWVGPTGVIGLGFQVNPYTLGQQVWYGTNLYTVSVAGTPAAAAPPVHVAGAVASGTATFAYAGTAAQVTANYNGATQNVRSLNLVNQGSGYFSTPGVGFVAAVGTVPAAANIVVAGVAGATTFLAQKQSTASMTGAMPINNSIGVNSISTVVGSKGYYTVAPAVGIGGPTGLNFVTSGGTGYTAAPTVTFTGGTLAPGSPSPVFTTTVANGKVLGIVMTTSPVYLVPPTGITIAGVGVGAAAAFPPGCWATATANLGANGQITSYTVTNPGFGYIIAPTVTLSAPLAGEFAAAVPGARVGLYNLSLTNFAGATINGVTPVFTNTPHTETGTGSLWPTAPRSMNILTMGTGNLGMSVTGGDVNLQAATGPLALTSGTLNMGGSTLIFERPTFLGQNAATASFVSNGTIELNGISTATTTRNFPFRAGNTFIGAVRLNIGTGSLGTGSDITRVRVTELGAPSGTATAPLSNMAGNRSFEVAILSGTTYGTGPSMQLAFDGLDGIVSDNPSLYLCQSTTGLAGPWTVRSTSTGVGALPGAGGTRTSAAAAPGPIAFAATSQYGWSTTFVPPAPLQFTVARTTGNTYQSISPLPAGDGTGTLSTASGDEGTQTIALPFAFNYQGSPVTNVLIHANGYLLLQNALYTPAAASSWDNTLGAFSPGGTPDINKRNVIAPFYDDLNKASPVIYHKVVGNVATFEWFNTTFFGLSGPQMYFQVVLDGSDNSITFNYGDMQLFNGTQNVRYQYTCGLSGSFIQVPAQPGQIFQQQYANTDNFSHERSTVAGWGANGLAAGPEPRSRIKFTPGPGYVQPPPPSPAAPVNDDPAGAITRPGLLAFPNNIAWENGSNTTNLYSTRYATSTAAPAATSPNTGAAAKDVWFQFTATALATTVRIYGSGGYLPRAEVWDNTLTTQLGTNVGTMGLLSDVSLSGLTIGANYYVRVYHDRVGTTALATATTAAGVVNSVTVTTPGTNYTTCAQAFGYNGANQGPMVNFTGGGSETAVIAVTNPTTTQVLPSLVTSNLGFNGGSGYSSAPTVTFDSPDWGITGEFGIVVFAPVLNDNCAGAFTIAPDDGCTATVGTTGGASASPEAVCTGNADDDVWYKFIAAAPNAQVTVTSDVAFDAAVEVFSGACGGLTSIACVNGLGLGGTENANLSGLVPGNTYFLRIYHAPALGGSSAFTVCVNHTPSCPVTFSPVTGGTVTSATPTLSWNAVSPIGATAYNVYLDNNPVPTTLVSAGQVGTSFTTAPLGAGTFYWRVEPINGSADTTTTCVVNSFIVPSCFAPSAVSVGFVTSTSANVSFTCTGCTGTYIVEYGLAGFTPGTGATPGAGGTIVTGAASPILMSPIIGGNIYHVYVRQECIPSVDYSLNTPVTIYSAPPGCGDNYYDDGGPTLSYTNAAFNTLPSTTICPNNPGDVVIVTFTSFQTESSFDPLYAFDGPSTASPLIASANGSPGGAYAPNPGPGGWWGTVAPTNTGTPGVVISTHPSGCLTFKHHSDGSVVQAGWTATVLCATPHYTCAVAEPITCGGLETSFTIGGTNTLPGSACFFNGAASTGGVSWFEYVAGANEDVTASTCGLASWNTRISVFHAPAGDCTVLNCIALNDNSPGCASNSSEVVFPAVSGETYYIAVHGDGAAQGAFQLSVTCAPSCTPATGNDLCSAAAPLTPVINDGLGVPTTGDNTCAYYEHGTSCSGPDPVAGVWYSFNTGVNTNMLLTLLDQNLNGAYTADGLSYALFDGTCTNMLATSEIDCQTAGAGVELALPTLLPSTNYLLLVYNAGGIGTEGTFGVLLEFPAQNDAGVTDVISPDGLICTTQITPFVELTNFGAVPLTSVDIVYDVDGGVPQVFNWTGGPLGFNQTTVVTLPVINVTPNPHTFNATVQNPNGQPDGIASNDASSSTFDSNGEAVTIVMIQDRWGAETTWEIYDALEIAPIATGGPYANLGANGTLNQTVTECLPLTFGNCFTLRVYDSFGDGMCCNFGVGSWEIRTPSGALLLRDNFHGSGTLTGSAIYDGDQSPALGANPAYTGHEFCIPKGPSDIEATECGIMTNTLSNKVYCVASPGTGPYMFEFSNPDQAFRRRISVPVRYVKFSQLQTNPLVAGVRYFARARRDAANDGYFNDNWGSGCEMGLDISVISGCAQLIDDIDLPTHSCGVTRAFGSNDKVWATPILGATQYRFRFQGILDQDGPLGPIPPAAGTRQFTQASYVRTLSWATFQLVNGETYNVTVEVFVNGVWSGFCGPVCTLTISNPPAFGGRADVAEENNSDVQLFPNPVRDGNVNLVINGLSGLENTVHVEVYDLFGKRVYNQTIATAGATSLRSNLELGTQLASGLYMVDITMGERHSVQRLSVQ